MDVPNTDENQFHTVETQHYSFTIPVRYQNLECQGIGASGLVAKAFDRNTGKHVAIKKLTKPFWSSKRAKKVYRKIKLGLFLNHPDANVVQLQDVFTPEKTVEDFQSLYLVFNYIDFDLRQLIRRKPLNEPLVRIVVYSILRGLKFIHSAGISHCDLKPGYIRLDRESNVYILNSGLCRSSDEYITNKWWCAPEAVLNREHNDLKLDVWSVGCIMGEMIIGQPLFRGEDDIRQLDQIFNLCGTPSKETLRNLCSSDEQDYVLRLPQREKKDLKQKFGFRYDPLSGEIVSGVSEAGVNFLERLLLVDPNDRPTIEEALADPFLSTFYDPEYEPTTERLVDSLQDANLTIAEWKSIVWSMVQQFVPPAWISQSSDDDK